MEKPRGENSNDSVDSLWNSGRIDWRRRPIIESENGEKNGSLIVLSLDVVAGMIVVERIAGAVFLGNGE